MLQRAESDAPRRRTDASRRGSMSQAPSESARASVRATVPHGGKGRRAVKRECKRISGGRAERVGIARRSHGGCRAGVGGGMSKQIRWLHSYFSHTACRDISGRWGRTGDLRDCAPDETREKYMHVALGVALGSIVVAPFVGKWRANVWLRNREDAFAAANRPALNNVIEIA